MPFNNSTFDLGAQTRFMDRHGDWVRYFPARKCSCSATSDANRADPNCLVCRGLGYYYNSSRTIQGLVTSISSQKMLLESGIALPGDMVFSEPMAPGVVLTDFDMIRITLAQGQPYEGELVVRSATLSDQTIYNMATIDEVYQNNPTTGGLTTYARPADYTWTPKTNLLVWGMSAKQPATGSVYGVKGAAIFDWIVFTPPNSRFERGTPLGNRVILRKRHVVLQSLRGLPA